MCPDNGAFIENPDLYTSAEGNLLAPRGNPESACVCACVFVCVCALDMFALCMFNEVFNEPAAFCRISLCQGIVCLLRASE